MLRLLYSPFVNHSFLKPLLLNMFNSSQPCFSNVYPMSRSVVSSPKTLGCASCLKLDTTRIENFVNYLKNFTVYLSILTLIFNLQVILAEKIGGKI